MYKQYFSIVFDISKLTKEEQEAIFDKVSQGWKNRTVVTAGFDIYKPNYQSDDELENENA